MLSTSLDDSHLYVKSLFSDVLKPSPWPEKSPLSPLAENLHPVLEVAPQFATFVTCVEVKVHEVKVVAILNTGTPVNFISSQLARKIKMASEINTAVVYETTGKLLPS